MTTITVDFDVEIPMRDGTILRADVFRPAGPGRWPVILRRTPYNKAAPVGRWDLAPAVAAQGYVVVVQDCRGRYASDGQFTPFIVEIRDGYDSVEWAAAEPWSTGDVGLVGNSYNGATQWLAAVSGPPSLRCIAPGFTSGDYYGGWAYKGGALFAAFAYAWTVEFIALGELDRRSLPDADGAAERERLLTSIERLRRTLNDPPGNGRAFVEDLAPYYGDWLDHPASDDYWSQSSLTARASSVTVPTFSAGGWFDIFREGPVEMYAAMRDRGPASLRDDHRLLMGPWVHSSALSRVSGERRFPRNAMVDLDAAQLAWYDRWLRGAGPEPGSQPPVRYYTMGTNEWHDSPDWPPPGVEERHLYLHSGGRANSLRGDGALAWGEPAAEPPDQFLYNPRDPVPTVGAAGIYDQRSVEERRDILVYTSDPLDASIEVTGDPHVVLHVTTSATDTDFVVKLVDVDPSGYAANMVEGILRLRYRDSFEHPLPAEPGRPYQLTIPLGPLSNTFLPGHRVRLEVSSSHFPRFDRNLNLWPEPEHIAAAVPATQTVLHSSDYPSRLVLPVRSTG